MWRILRDTGIAPAASIRGAEGDGRMPEVAGVGFTDVGSGSPGTDSSQFGAAHFTAWRPGFFSRLEAQTRRASAAIGCTCGCCGAPAVVAFSGKKQFQELFAAGNGGGRGRQKKAAGVAAAGAAAVAAAAEGSPVSSPEQAAAAAAGRAAEAACGTEAAERLPVLQAGRPASIATGRQWVLPEGWPLPLSTEVWVMTSTSGAAPMTRQQRYAPWQALAERLAREPWPRQCQLRCGGTGAS
ncbi:uracil-dna glycosylase superfamily [Chlorella sorokiniana]|uniref:Uracil-dna glycosylase superfamily n=1 Tax=Chlorella sorokiniana TaxID=3076 RepID=A0A2P6TKJ5_CHLSO|nr:uracil-dna glycosylase superfamily [Chlorella sorokiniana]|eukprot:PRW44558.1 uracil-dna glycosylase superfamily [Chlorella sorokiniana]